MNDPVLPGQLHIEGHFTGTVTSASHVLEISIPLNYEVSNSDLKPILVAFRNQAQAAEAADLGASEDSARSSPPQDAGSKLWQDLLAILAADANGKEGRTREIMKMAQQAMPSCEDTGGEDVQLGASSDMSQFVREETTATLRIELNAKEALLEQVMLERQRLQQENERLTEHVKEGGLKRFMRRASKALTGGVKEFEHALCKSTEEPGYGSECSEVPVQALQEGFVSLNGTYMGHVTTNSHNLEVVLPLDGPVPAAPVVELVHALSKDSDADASDEASKSPRNGGCRSSVDPQVWHHLLNIFDADVTREHLAARALGSQAHAELQRSVATQDELAAELQKLKAELAERSADTGSRPAKAAYISGVRPSKSLALGSSPAQVKTWTSSGLPPNKAATCSPVLPSTSVLLRPGGAPAGLSVANQRRTSEASALPELTAESRGCIAMTKASMSILAHLSTMVKPQRSAISRHAGCGTLTLAVATATFGVYVHSRGQADQADVVDQPLPPPAFLGLGSLGALGSGTDLKMVTSTVTTAFPGAMKGSAVMAKLLKTVHPFGLRRRNTIYGQSIGSDEINGDPGHLTTHLTRYYGKTFQLGGLGGAPYGGKTGFMAFSHHVPENGHVLLVFGPHIGFTPDGQPGKFLRKGQASVSTACGAVIAAQAQISSGQSIPADASDMEQSWLRAKLKPYASEVAASKQPMVELTMKCYQAVEKEIFAIVNTDFGPGNLVLLGGIQINMPYPLPGFFMPLHFSIRSRDVEPQDLMSAFA